MQNNVEQDVIATAMDDIQQANVQTTVQHATQQAGVKDIQAFEVDLHLDDSVELYSDGSAKLLLDKPHRPVTRRPAGPPHRRQHRQHWPGAPSGGSSRGAYATVITTQVQLPAKVEWTRGPK